MTLLERLSAGRRDRARAGWKSCGPAPFGYRWGSADGGRSVLFVHPEESLVVVEAFRLYAHPPFGFHPSLKLVSGELFRRGLLNRAGKAFSTPALAWMLKNPTYVGRVPYGGKDYPGRHEPLVATITFNRARRRARDQYRSSRR